MTLIIRNFFIGLVFCFFVSCGHSINEKIQDFTIETLDGKVINTSTLTDKILVINLWATWCGPCVREIPNLNDLQEKYKDNDQVLFLAISNESVGRVKRFVANTPFLYQQAVSESVSKQLQSGLVNSIPKHIVIDQDKTIRTYIDGAPADIEQQLSFTIEQLLK